MLELVRTGSYSSISASASSELSSAPTRASLQNSSKVFSKRVFDLVSIVFTITVDIKRLIKGS